MTRFFALAAFLATTIVASAQDATAAKVWTLGPISVEQAWARVVPGSKSGAVYLTIHNKSSADDHLMAVESPSAKRSAIHSSKIEGGIAKMEPVPGGMALPSHGEITMRPGGLHIMLSGLDALKPGDEISVALILRDAGELKMQIPILPLNVRDPAEKHSGH